MQPSQDISTRFTPLQIELLRLYALNLPEEDLVEIKNLIGNYLLGKMSDKVDTSVKKNGYTNEDYEKWLNEKS